MQRAKRHELIAQSKGANIQKEIVYDTVRVEIPLAGNDSIATVNPTIDTVDFFDSMEKNDSLVLAIDAMHKSIRDGMTLDKEKTMSALKRANAEIRALRNRIQNGFSRDSTYTLEADSLCTVMINIKGGLLRNMEHHRKPTVLKAEEIVPVEIRNILKAGYTWKEIAIGGAAIGFILLVIGFILGYSSKNK